MTIRGRAGSSCGPSAQGPRCCPRSRTGRARDARVRGPQDRTKQALAGATKEGIPIIPVQGEHQGLAPTVGGLVPEPGALRDSTAPKSHFI